MDGIGCVVVDCRALKRILFIVMMFTPSMKGILKGCVVTCEVVKLEVLVLSERLPLNRRIPSVPNSSLQQLHHLKSSYPTQLLYFCTTHCSDSLYIISIALLQSINEQGKNLHLRTSPQLTLDGSLIPSSHIYQLKLLRSRLATQQLRRRIRKVICNAGFSIWMHYIQRGRRLYRAQS